MREISYRLKDDEGLAEGLKRIVLEQIDTALDSLKATAKNKDLAIHDARVCIKKIRALLRLMRTSLGNQTYQKEDIAYRDAGRALSKVRDSVALLEVVDKLIEHFSDQLSPDPFASVRTPLMRSKRARQPDRKSAMTKTAKALREGRRRVQKWPEPVHDRALAKGQSRVFKRGHSTFQTAYDRPSVENFHEWRKQVKHLLYQTRVLRPLWPNVMKASATELRTLGKLLSEDHDLGLLREKVSRQLDESENRTEIEALVALIDKRRNELQADARILGSRLYAERPKTFLRRTETYWRAWRLETKVDPIVES